MRVLICGDIVGKSGRNAIRRELPNLKQLKQIDFVLANGENAANDGKGITKEIAEEFFSLGIDVITSGNHIWDKVETIKYIENEKRLLRPANLAAGSPGKGYGIYFSKVGNYKVGVINLMGNVFMRKTDDVFNAAKEIIKTIILKKKCRFFYC